MLANLSYAAAESAPKLHDLLLSDFEVVHDSLHLAFKSINVGVVFPDQRIVSLELCIVFLHVGGLTSVFSDYSPNSSRAGALQFHLDRPAERSFEVVLVLSQRHKFRALDVRVDAPLLDFLREFVFVLLVILRVVLVPEGDVPAHEFVAQFVFRNVGFGFF